MMDLFDHITGQELFGMMLGIGLFWIIKWTKEKDVFDDNGDDFSNIKWLKEWFVGRYDNIVAHLFFSFSALYIGVDNVRSWMAETVHVPEGVDEIGAAFLFGVLGTFGVNVLKKAA